MTPICSNCLKMYMDSTDKKLKIVFAPGCFDNLDMSQEEMDEFVKMIEGKVADGSIFTDSRPLDPDNPEDAELMARMEEEMIKNADRKLQ